MSGWLRLEYKAVEALKMLRRRRGGLHEGEKSGDIVKIGHRVEVHGK